MQPLATIRTTPSNVLRKPGAARRSPVWLPPTTTRAWRRPPRLLHASTTASETARKAILPRYARHLHIPEPDHRAGDDRQFHPASGGGDGQARTWQGRLPQAAYGPAQGRSMKPMDDTAMIAQMARSARSTTQQLNATITQSANVQTVSSAARSASTCRPSGRWHVFHGCRASPSPRRLASFSHPRVNGMDVDTARSSNQQFTHREV